MTQANQTNGAKTGPASWPEANILGPAWLIRTLGNVPNMNAVTLLVITMAGALTALADGTNVLSVRRYPSVLVSCFVGGLDSTNWHSLTATNAKSSHRFICGPATAASEVQWDFLGVQDEKDLYRFTRRFPVNAAAETTVTNMVLFGGETVTVFNDNHQTVLMEVFPGAPKPVPYTGDPMLYRATNITVVCRLRSYWLGAEEYPGDRLASADENILEKLRQNVRGFVLEIVEPATLRGRFIRMHHDGPIGYPGNPLEVVEPGKLYQFAALSTEIGATNFWRCSVGWPAAAKVVQPERSK